MKRIKDALEKSYVLRNKEIHVMGHDFTVEEAFFLIQNSSGWYDVFQIEEDMYEWGKIEDVEHEVEDLEEEKEGLLAKYGRDWPEEYKNEIAERIDEIEREIMRLCKKRDAIEEAYVETCVERLREAVEEVVDEWDTTAN